MMRDITIGQYYPADSILHRLDPRVTFVSTLVYIISLFVFSSWVGYGVAALFLVAMIVLSKVPFGFMVKGLKPIMVLLLITMFFNLVFTPGEVLWSFWILKITKAAGMKCLETTIPYAWKSVWEKASLSWNSPAKIRASIISASNATPAYFYVHYRRWN